MKQVVMCLSIRQPWAWLIVNSHKDIENRTWRTAYRGDILIHAGKGMTRQEYADCQEFMESIDIPEIQLPAYEELERGGIVGVARLTGCVNTHPSPWFVGDVGWVIEGAKPVPMVPCAGQLSLFMPPTAVIDMVMKAAANG